MPFFEIMVVDVSSFMSACVSEVASRLQVQEVNRCISMHLFVECV